MRIKSLFAAIVLAAMSVETSTTTLLAQAQEIPRPSPSLNETWVDRASTSPILSAIRSLCGKSNRRVSEH